MKVAVIGSRGLWVDIGKYLPDGVTKIISGGARGIDSAAEEYADKNGIAKEIFLPNYAKYAKRAPLIRNQEIVLNSDIVIAIWDGSTRGTKYTIDFAKRIGKQVKVFIIDS